MVDEDCGALEWWAEESTGSTGPRARVMTGSMSVHRPVPQVQLTGGKADTTDAVRLICSLRERPDRHY